MLEDLAADARRVLLARTAHEAAFDQSDDCVARRAVIHACRAGEFAQRERTISSHQNEEQPLTELPVLRT